jgi:hypothetical protein
LPEAGATVEILPGHKIIYDRHSDQPIRMLHISGTLSFARDRNTRLDVGLLKVGGDSTEDGFNCTHREHPGQRLALRSERPMT